MAQITGLMDTAPGPGAEALEATVAAVGLPSAASPKPAHRAHPAHATALSFRVRPWVIPCQILVDVLALELSLLIGFCCRKALEPWFPIGLSQNELQMLMSAVLLVPLAYAAVGLYPGYGLGPVERLRRRLGMLSVLLLVLIAWHSVILNFWMPQGAPSRGCLLATLAVAWLICPAAAALFRGAMIRRRLWGLPVAVIGTGPLASVVIHTLKSNPELGLVPTCVLDQHRARIGTEIEGVPVTGDLDHAGAVTRHVSIALVALPDVNSDDLIEMTRALPFARLMIVPNLVGLSTQGIRAHDLSGIAAVEVRKNLLERHNRVLKRAMDCAVGLPMLLAALPIIGIMSAWIKLQSPGPAIYSQPRVGRDGKMIRVHKLRTMYTDSDKRLQDHLRDNPEAQAEWSSRFKLRDDPRILPVIGKFLRRTSLDELPQLWNIVRGEMSLVGPRPFPTYHLEQFDESFLSLRQSVTPGLTGLWQVSSRSDGDLTVQEQHDSYYIRNWSIWFDLHLLAQTAKAVLTGKGAY